MTGDRLLLVVCFAGLAGLGSSGYSQGGDESLLVQARQAAGGVARFQRFSTLELRGAVIDSNAPGATGAMVFRAKLPNSFLLVQKQPGRPEYYRVALHQDNYAAKYGTVELPRSEEAVRRLRARFSRLLTTYLLYVPPGCRAEAPGSHRLAFRGDCGEFTLEFDANTSAVAALRFDMLVMKSVRVDLNGVDSAAAKGPLQRPTVVESVRTKYSDFRTIDGWRVPFVALSDSPGRTETFRVTSVRFDLALYDSHFASVAGLDELEQWIDSVVR